MQYCDYQRNWGAASESARKYGTFLFALVWLSAFALTWTFLFL